MLELVSRPIFGLAEIGQHRFLSTCYEMKKRLKKHFLKELDKPPVKPPVGFLQQSMVSHLALKCVPT